MIFKTIYDIVEKQNYYNSGEGLSSRIKVRIRWYGPLFGYIEKAVLEINGGLTSYLNINKGDLIIHPSLNGK